MAGKAASLPVAACTAMAVKAASPLTQPEQRRQRRWHRPAPALPSESERFSFLVDGAEQRRGLKGPRITSLNFGIPLSNRLIDATCGRQSGGQSVLRGMGSCQIAQLRSSKAVERRSWPFAVINITGCLPAVNGTSRWLPPTLSPDFRTLGALYED